MRTQKKLLLVLAEIPIWRRREDPRCTAAGRAAVHASRSEIDNDNYQVVDGENIDGLLLMANHSVKN